MSVPEAVRIEKPLPLGEILATAMRLYGQRALAYLSLGALQAAALLSGTVLPFAAQLALLALAFAVSFAVTVRLAVGDPYGAALLEAARALPTLVAMALIVAVPFYLGSAWLLFLILSALWLGLTAFAIPAAMVEKPAEEGLGARTTHALARTASLARIEYLHAVGVVAALVMIYVLVGVALAVALSSYADSGRLVALAIEQVVLAPFFFLGLTVLYFEQQARARKAEG